MKTIPFAHQTTAFERSKDATDYALFMEMGTGKSRVILETAQYMFAKDRIDCLLVLAPKGAYLNWARNEAPAHLENFEAAWWSSENNKPDNKWLEEVTHDPSRLCLKIICVNIEALSSKRGVQYVEMLLKKQRCLMVVDESTAIKNVQAARTKAAIKLGRLARYRRILTGSPITKSPLDLYGQCAFLDFRHLGFTSFYAFRNHYAQIIQIKAGPRMFPKIIGYRNLDELTRKLEKFAYRVMKSECLDLPEKIFVRRYVEMSPEQDKAYRQMKHEAMILVKDKLATATVAMTQLMKMHQVLCGHVKYDDGTIHHLPNNRLSALLEVLQEMDGKVIIWANYVEDIKLILKRLNEEYGQGSAVAYFGQTSKDDRNEATDLFQDPKSSVRFFISNETGSKGITLTAANQVVRYSYNYNLETWIQSEDRNHRIGQERAVTYVELAVAKSVDEKILNNLRGKKDVAALVLSPLSLLEEEVSSEAP